MMKVLKICMCLLMCLCLFGCSSDKVELTPKSELVSETGENVKTVEFGENISLNANDYLDNEEDVLSKTKVQLIDKDGKEVADTKKAAVGDYILTFIYNDDEKTKTTIKVSVKDTTAPVFNKGAILNKYEVEYGKSLDKSIFTKDEVATDLSKVEITVDDSKVNYKKAGNYEAVVTAKDEHGNATEKKVTIVVKAEEKKESSSTTASGSTTKPSSGSSSSTKPSSSSKPSSSGNSGSSSSGTTGKPVETPKKEYDVGNSGMLFDTEAEAIAWADKYMMEHVKTIGGYVYWSTYDKWTIGFEYY